MSRLPTEGTAPRRFRTRGLRTRGSRIRGSRKGWAAILCILGIAVPALAVIPQFWEVRTFAEWREGDLDGLSVTGDGEVVLSPLFDVLYDTGQPLVFSADASGDGTVYLGTGHEGRVYRVAPDGTGTLLADLGELDVLALAVGPGGDVFAGTSPEGSVYRIDGDGNAILFFDPEDTYIWDLAFDRDGRLLVATGEEGVIYRVDADGAAEVFYDSDNAHILSILPEADGNLIAGGSPQGYVYRIAEDGNAFVLYDSGMREVRDLALSANGILYAAVLDTPGGGGAASSGAAGAASGVVTGSTITVSLGGSLAAGAAAQDEIPAPEGGSPGSEIGGGRGPGSGNAPSRILELLPSGAVTTVWQSASEMVYSVLHRGGVLYFSTGSEGRIYALGAPGRPTLLVESTEEQTTRLLEAGGRILAASSNLGKLWELGDDARSEGVYESRVRDTGAVSTWGRLSWSGRAATLETRSGNTASPDRTWSDWASPGAGGEVTSPPARFIQWRAALGGTAGDDPVLSSVTLPYLQQNFRPEVSSLDVLQPGIALRPQQASTTPAALERSGVSGRVVELIPRPGSRTLVEAGAQALRWTATDQNSGDVLSYALYYRGDREEDWKILASGLGDAYYTIEPNTLPDGMYTVRVVASDAGSNPPDLALTGEFVSRPFAVDSTPPEVTLVPGPVSGSRVRFEAEAADPTSTLKQAEISVDAGPWRPVFPVDGILDGLSEEFVFESGPLGAGEHVIAFRIYDQNDNVGIEKSIVRIP